MATLARTRGRPRAFDRNQALRAAQQFIWQHGYESLSLSQLEIVMGIGKTSVYAAFGSKLAILQEAVDLYMAEAGGQLIDVLEDKLTTHQAFTRLFDICAENFTDPSRPAGCLLVAAAPVCSEENAAATAFLKTRRAAVAAILRARLERGIAEGDMAKTAPIPALVEYLMTVIHGMSIQARDGSSEEALKATAALTLLTLRNAAAKRH